jgi:hypothetical protein
MLGGYIPCSSVRELQSDKISIQVDVWQPSASSSASRLACGIVWCQVLHACIWHAGLNNLAADCIMTAACKCASCDNVWEAHIEGGHADNACSASLAKHFH